MPNLAISPKLVIEQIREVVVADIAADRPEVALSHDLRIRVERAILELASAGQTDIEQLRRYATSQARAWLGSRPFHYSVGTVDKLTA